MHKDPANRPPDSLASFESVFTSSLIVPVAITHSVWVETLPVPLLQQLSLLKGKNKELL